MRRWRRAVVSMVIFAGPAQALSDKRLDLGRSDTQIHITTAFAASLAGSEFLEWRKMETWKATTLSSLVVAAASLIKEFAVDEFASGNDLLADAIGIGANAALQFSWRF